MWKLVIIDLTHFTVELILCFVSLSISKRMSSVKNNSKNT